VTRVIATYLHGTSNNEYLMISVIFIFFSNLRSDCNSCNSGRIDVGQFFHCHTACMCCWIKNDKRNFEIPQRPVFC